MNIVQIIEKLEQAQPFGFQITKRTGCLSSTWLLYKRQSVYYFFDINQKIEFIDRYRYTAAELSTEMAGAWFGEVELVG
jgi:hypothetical protein